RRLYLRHAKDEESHAERFRRRGAEILRGLPAERRGAVFQAEWLAPGERGLDALRVDAQGAAALLAFLHLSEKAAAGRFAVYGQVLGLDPATRDVFLQVLKDEAFHMSYTYRQLERLTGRPRRH